MWQQIDPLQIQQFITQIKARWQEIASTLIPNGKGNNRRSNCRRSCACHWMDRVLPGRIFEEKGENQAIHEDIGKLVDQVRAVTQTTKEIESKISSDVWTRQKQWEMKRDVLFETAKRIVELDNLLLTLDTLVSINPQDTREWLKTKHETMLTWNETVRKFEETQTLVAIICSKETHFALHNVTLLMKELAGKLVNNDLKAYKLSSDMISKGIITMNIAIRKELGIEEVIALNASASSS